MQFSLQQLSDLFFEDRLSQEFIDKFSQEAFATKNELFLAMDALLTWKHQRKKLPLELPIVRDHCPLYASYRFHWAALPHAPDHALLAKILFVLGKISEQEHLEMQAKNLFAWQERWTDHRKKRVLLFAQRDYPLEDVASDIEEGLFYDENFHIVLKRTQETTVLLTSSGCKSSMGSFLHQEIGVNSFGPRLFSKDTFGIITHSYDPAVFFREEEGFSFQFSAKCAEKGRTILPDLEDIGPTIQFFSFQTKLLKNCLTCDFRLPYLLQAFSFCFYASAIKCRVKETHILHPQSNDHYQGPSQRVEFLGKRARIRLEFSPSCQMEVLPLKESRDDFLVVYTTEQKSGSFALFAEEY